VNIPEPELDPNAEVWRGDLRLADTAEETIRFLRARVAAGQPWYRALLEAVAMWTRPEETADGRFYRYLIGGEAFDWLLLAERLTATIADLVPEPERCALLFHNRAPEELDQAEFKATIGPAKYRAHLNYLYGVMLEEALQLAVEQEIQKEQLGRAWKEDPRTTEGVYWRIYSESLETLLKRFWSDPKVKLPPREPTSGPALSWAERKEFTYWLFKYRLSRCDRARVASDTRKALNELNRQWAAHRRRETAPVPSEEPEDYLELRPLSSVSIDRVEESPSGFASSSS
jgi:hypothetical protein